MVFLRGDVKRAQDITKSVNYKRIAAELIILLE